MRTFPLIEKHLVPLNRTHFINGPTSQWQPGYFMAGGAHTRTAPPPPCLVSKPGADPEFQKRGGLLLNNKTSGGGGGGGGGGAVHVKLRAPPPPPPLVSAPANPVGIVTNDDDRPRAHMHNRGELLVIQILHYM